MKDASSKLSTEPYKGVRDFYPEDLRVQNYMFSIWRKTLEQFGYEEYNVSVLEPAELYRAKSGQEIVNEQTYSFIDRGEREVTLRPEMTPSVARLVAGRNRELGFPLRLYSIPNLFRYERPQRGRLREHWQLNADVFGIPTKDAEIELIQIASSLLKNFGVKDDQFQIKVSSKRLINAIMTEWYELSDEKAQALSKLIDRKKKMTEDEFQRDAEKIVGKAFHFLSLKESSEEYQEALALLPIKEALQEVNEVIAILTARGITNVVLDHELMRGFDYYTGIIFEIFDTHKDNNRSLFGGGRYDGLVGLFIDRDIPAAGFGMGDVTMKDMLETYGLIPKLLPHTHLALIPFGIQHIELAENLATKLRSEGINVSVDPTTKSLGDRIKNADKLSIPNIIVIGDEEKTGSYKLKNLKTSEETSVSFEELVKALT